MWERSLSSDPCLRAFPAEPGLQARLANLARHRVAVPMRSSCHREQLDKGNHGQSLLRERRLRVRHPWRRRDVRCTLPVRTHGWTLRRCSVHRYRCSRTWPANGTKTGPASTRSAKRPTSCNSRAKGLPATRICSCAGAKAVPATPIAGRRRRAVRIAALIVRRPGAGIRTGAHAAAPRSATSAASSAAASPRSSSAWRAPR